MARKRTAARSAESGEFVSKKEADENPTTTVVEEFPQEEPTAVELQFPEVLGNDYHQYQLRLRFFVKQLDVPVLVKGVEGNVGDYVFKASDGGVGILTESELNEHYEPCPPAGTAS